MATRPFTPLTPGLMEARATPLEPRDSSHGELFLQEIKKVVSRGGGGGGGIPAKSFHPG